MKIIVGLGNPGPRYRGTRHNAGFEAAEALAEKNGIIIDYLKHHAFCGTGRINNERVLIAEPQTFMNESGTSVREILSYYKIDPEQDLIVISDDIDLPIGRIRVRPHGSAGGHNGLKNIIQHVGTDKFARVRIGIGKKPADWQLVDWVLSRFAPSESAEIGEACKRAAESIECLITEGVESAMSRFNRPAQNP